MNYSIVIPAKNEQQGLSELLPTLLLLSPNEVIVVNDGSTDDTQKVCEELGVKVVNHAYSKGNGAAIKTGAREAKNEQQGLSELLPTLLLLSPSEVIVVNDGSTDDTQKVCEELGVKVVNHAYSKGNGAAIKTGAREAKNDVIVFMDADGQHKADDVPKLLEEFSKGYDLVVGARGNDSQASLMRGLGNRFYNWFSSLIVGHKIHDLTSGFRVVQREKFLEFMYLLPNGFSYPTTSTMAFFRAGYSVKYYPIDMPHRVGNSHLNVVKDGIKFLLIIFKVGTLYSPLKIFFPIAMFHFSLGLMYYGYTFLTAGRFTNMGGLLLTTAVLVFLIGLVSEQITNLLYKK